MPSKSTPKTVRKTKIRVKTKAPVTINMPPKVLRIATEWAEGDGRSLSGLVEDLLRRHLEKNGVRVNLTPEEFDAIMRGKFGVSTLLPEEGEHIIVE